MRGNGLLGDGGPRYRSNDSGNKLTPEMMSYHNRNYCYVSDYLAAGTGYVALAGYAAPVLIELGPTLGTAYAYVKDGVIIGYYQGGVCYSKVMQYLVVDQLRTAYLFLSTGFIVNKVGVPYGSVNDMDVIFGADLARQMMYSKLTPFMWYELGGTAAGISDLGD